MNLQQVTELLPPVVIQIADLIGFPATERLLSAFGGTTFPIGKGLRAFGGQRAALLRDTIGDHNTKLLFQKFTGEPLYLPRCERALRELICSMDFTGYEFLFDSKNGVQCKSC